MDNKPLTLLILNGKGAGNDDLREAITTLREEGFDIAVRVTFEKGDGDRYVKEAIALKAETVVAGGGDGTINEIATALAASSADHRPVLGILQRIQLAMQISVRRHDLHAVVQHKLILHRDFSPFAPALAGEFADKLLAIGN